MDAERLSAVLLAARSPDVRVEPRAGCVQVSWRAPDGAEARVLAKALGGGVMLVTPEGGLTVIRCAVAPGDDGICGRAMLQVVRACWRLAAHEFRR